MRPPSVPPMTLPRRPAAVIFDMDGLLFDTETLHQQAILAAAAAAGLTMDHAFFRRMLGCPWPTNRALLLTEYGENFAVDAFRDAWIGRFATLIAAGPYLKPGAAELLDTLDRLGLPRAIATSSSHRGVQTHLGAHALGARFHAIVAHGDYDAGKPAPDPFLRAAEQLGAAPWDCLALEDSFNGIRSAAAAGTMAVMVPDLMEPTAEIRALCAVVVSDLHAVRDLVLDACRVVRPAAQQQRNHA